MKYTKRPQQIISIPDVCIVVNDTRCRACIVIMQPATNTLLAPNNSLTTRTELWSLDNLSTNDTTRYFFNDIIPFLYCFYSVQYLIQLIAWETTAFDLGGATPSSSEFVKSTDPFDIGWRASQPCVETFGCSKNFAIRFPIVNFCCGVTFKYWEAFAVH